MQRITHETADGYTTDFRKYLKMPYRRAKYRNINEIPRLCVAGEFRRTPMGDLVMESYNGLVVLEVRELADADACEVLKQRAGAAFQPPAVNAFGRQLNGCEGLRHKHTKHGEAYHVQDRIRA